MPVKKTSRQAVSARKPAAKSPTKKAPLKKAKAVAKSPVKKPVAKKAVVKKAAVKKPVVKKAAPAKKAVAKKVVAKKLVAVKKAVTPVSKPAASKKPLASKDKSAVKATVSAVRASVVPIRAITSASAPKSTSGKNSMSKTKSSAGYEPTDNEEFMSTVMKEYFRQRLLAWKEELLRESEETLHVLQEEGNMQKPDITDRASEETDLAIEFRTRDRERKLLNKINEALGRIEDGSYGYCEETGDPIPVKRLIARPTATRTLEAEELHERRERTQRDQYE